jgi:hypothetical protein
MSLLHYPTDRNNPAGNIPVYIVAAPTPDSQGRYPTAKNNITGGIPVHIVARPVLSPTYPNDKSKAAGAIPVKVLAAPASPAGSSDQGLSTGAIPIWDVGALPGAALRYPSNQALVNAAIPVWRTN